MQISIKGFISLFVLAALGLVSACSAEVGEDAASDSSALAKRCTVRGNPPLTSGCEAGETCRVEACTNSIPPSCWGTCQPSRVILPPGKCEGSFACLCGTPVCVDGEWTCRGNCGGGDTE